jgi:acetyltransferase-like isoleucine patch superfamily enzyme
MPDTSRHGPTGRVIVAWRLSCTAVVIVAEQVVLCAVAMLPAVALWLAAIDLVAPTVVMRAIAFSVLLIPSYILFALCLMTVSAVTARLTGARTPPHAELRIADMGWPLMRWIRYMVRIHVVRLFAGVIFRGSPIWSAYLRLNGARIGRRVYVNTLFISDHNLLELGDDVVIGSEVHISGHTVEGGIVKTAPVRLGNGVTIGVGTVVEIGVEIGAHAQIGALSFVPKHTTWPGGAVYAGIPARRLA